MVTTTKKPKAPKPKKNQFNPEEFAPTGDPAIDKFVEAVGDCIESVTVEPVEPPPAEEAPPDEEIEIPEFPPNHPQATPIMARANAIEEIEHDLCEQNITFREAEIEFNRADKLAKALKKAMEAEQSRLNGLVQNLYDARNGNFTPSLPFPAESDDDDDEGTPVEAWRAATLADIGIGGKMAENLADAGLSTLGAISDYTAAGKLLTDIAGIGQGKAEKISDLCADYHRTHPEPGNGAGIAQEGQPAADESQVLSAILSATDAATDAITLARAVIAEIKDAAPKVPVEGMVFAADVQVEAESIGNWIDTHGHVTTDQLTALKNMLEGLRKWLP